MKILLAPDSFKGSLSSKDVCNALKEGIKRAIDAEILEVPIADGGEGTVEAMVVSAGGRIIGVDVTGPLGERVRAYYGILNDGTAVIEMAASSGLYLVPEDKRNPLFTTTYGVGEVIKAALDNGCRNFIIGVGGSSTNDGGAGMAQALGVKLLSKDGNNIQYGGGNLDKLVSIDLTNIDKRIYESKFTVASDVDNPLCGERGASYVYGPQKGATPEMVDLLDKNLRHYADIVEKAIGKDMSEYPGAGAAGGLGFGLMAFLNANLRPGIEIVMEVAKMEEKIKSSDIVITGEGNTDYQTAFGKAPAGIAKLAKKYQKPVIILSGGLGRNYKDLYKIGVTSLFSIVDRPMTLKDAMINTEELIKNRIEDIMRTLIVFVQS
ncbi:glycerate kinase [Thermoanaerobacterium sp. RBIITD]|uniref:glycerate kinase n=1 Tax=Thermoanaerobacterium sp. RBIITD TaxID=1550240 RepID=UPI000BB68260|nr:glycerate kinase [Thermoanaerobacterium sp. RBIITD]SNX53602.1 glycerate kinase [Thermoanaerobacterium sp. RBIITD]